MRELYTHTSSNLSLVSRLIYDCVSATKARPKTSHTKCDYITISLLQASPCGSRTTELNSMATNIYSIKIIVHHVDMVDGWDRQYANVKWEYINRLYN